jgi:hypothetical protein
MGDKRDKPVSDDLRDTNPEGKPLCDSCWKNPIYTGGCELLRRRKGIVATQCQQYDHMDENALKIAGSILRIGERRWRKDEELRKMTLASERLM